MAENKNSGSSRMERSMDAVICCSKIMVHNCGGLCSERYCDRGTTQYFDVEINGMKMIIPLCDEHAEMMWERSKELL